MRLINKIPSPVLGFALGALPFLALGLAYVAASAARRAVNPADKLLPAPGQMWASAVSLATQPDPRSGDVLLWLDTASSLTRLGLGVGIAAAIGLCIGIAIGLIPLVRASLGGFVAALSLIPPLAILPILFITFGLGELSKVALIVIGIAPFLVRDVAGRVAEIPVELIVKAQTLGASTWRIVLRLALPQVLPRLIQSVRLSLGPAWLFLIAAEAIASTDGLGYRIFLVRRYLAMDVILPYVIWITLLAFALDWGLRRLSAVLFPWAEPGR